MPFLSTACRAALTALAAFGMLAAGASSPAEAKPAPVDDGWRLVWRDDFAGPAGASVDRNAWQFALGHCYVGCPAPNWGTGEVTEMTDSTDNVVLDGAGHLLIVPLRDRVDPGRWTSGRLETRRSDFAAPEGGALRVESRLALPTVTMTQAQGYWSAFWLLGADFRKGNVDTSGAGDLDVLEHINGQQEVVGTIHCSPRDGRDPCNELPDNVGLTGRTPCPPSGCLSGFHTYAVQVHRDSAPERIDWLVDGAVFHTVRADQSGMDVATWRSLVNRAFFIILNQSIGGNWPGPPTASTTSGVPLTVDHVAVWVRHSRPAKAEHPRSKPPKTGRPTPEHSHKEQSRTVDPAVHRKTEKAGGRRGERSCRVRPV